MYCVALTNKCTCYILQNWQARFQYHRFQSAMRLGISLSFYFFFFIVYSWRWFKRVTAYWGINCSMPLNIVCMLVYGWFVLHYAHGFCTTSQCNTLCDGSLCNNSYGMALLQQHHRAAQLVQPQPQNLPNKISLLYVQLFEGVWKGWLDPTWRCSPPNHGHASQISLCFFVFFGNFMLP